MANKPCLWWILFLFLSGSFVTTQAANHALLIGIADYPGFPLYGPVHDVEAIKTVLQTKWGFESANISVLLNKASTKKNILLAIEALYQRTKAGDNAFIYMSGHGTSAADQAIQAPLPTTSGAFIPIDVKFNAKNKQELVTSLVMGRDDIRPIIKKLDEGGRHVFVAIDACYSGNTVRGGFAADALPSRAIPLDKLAPKGFGEDEIGKASWQITPQTGYPYKNVYYLSASGEYEVATDIPPEKLREFPTVDNKPHGSFTDTLLRVLKGELSADNDKDGSLTYAELKTAVRHHMRQRGFIHTPQGLPSLAEDTQRLAYRGIFGTSGSVKTANDMANQTKKPGGIHTQNKPGDESVKPDPGFALQLQLDTQLQSLRSLLAKLSGVRLVEQKPDMRLRQKNSEFLLISAAGDLIVNLGKADTPHIVQAVKYHAWVHRQFNQPFANDFKVELEYHNPAKVSTAVSGEKVRFSLRSERDAYPLLLDMQADGTVVILYPKDKTEMRLLRANEVLTLDDIKVVPPFGRDAVQLYMLERNNQDYQRLLGQNFILDSHLAQNLENLLKTKTHKKGRANLELITVERSPP